jgi:hypothetical protein
VFGSTFGKLQQYHEWTVRINTLEEKPSELIFNSLSRTSCLLRSFVFVRAKMALALPRSATTFTISWVANGICPGITLKEFLKTALVTRVNRWEFTGLQLFIRATHPPLSHIQPPKVVRVHL